MANKLTIQEIAAVLAVSGAPDVPVRGTTTGRLAKAVDTRDNGRTLAISFGEAEPERARRAADHSAANKTNKGAGTKKQRPSYTVVAERLADGKSVPDAHLAPYPVLAAEYGRHARFNVGSFARQTKTDAASSNSSPVRGRIVDVEQASPDKLRLHIKNEDTGQVAKIHEDAAEPESLPIPGRGRGCARCGNPSGNARVCSSCVGKEVDENMALFHQHGGASALSGRATPGANDEKITDYAKAKPSATKQEARAKWGRVTKGGASLTGPAGGARLAGYVLVVQGLDSARMEKALAGGAHALAAPPMPAAPGIHSPAPAPAHTSAPPGIKAPDTQALHSDGRGNYHPERAALHERIVHHYLGGGDHADLHQLYGDYRAGNAKKVAVFTMGGSGSGKSFYAKRKFLQHPRFVQIDPDHIKENHLPGYTHENVTHFHEESSDIAKKLHEQTMQAGKSFVYDGTGANKDSLRKKIETTKAAGYEVHLHWAHVPVEVAKQRNAQRPRTVPDHILEGSHAAVRASFEANRHLADRTRVISNTSPHEAKSPYALRRETLLSERAKHDGADAGDIRKGIGRMSQPNHEPQRANTLVKLTLKPGHDLYGYVQQGKLHVEDIVHDGHSEREMVGARPDMKPIPLSDLEKRFGARPQTVHALPGGKASTHPLPEASRAAAARVPTARRHHKSGGSSNGK